SRGFGEAEPPFARAVVRALVTAFSMPRRRVCVGRVSSVHLAPTTRGRAVAPFRRGMLVAVAAALVVLPACGGGGSGGGGGNGENAPVKKGARVIEVEAKSFAFNPTKIQVGADEDVAIHLTSDDVFHDFVVQGKGHVVGASSGKDAKGGLKI